MTSSLVMSRSYLPRLLILFALLFSFPGCDSKVPMTETRSPLADLFDGLGLGTSRNTLSNRAQDGETLEDLLKYLPAIERYVFIDLITVTGDSGDLSSEMCPKDIAFKQLSSFSYSGFTVPKINVEDIWISGPRGGELQPCAPMNPEQPFILFQSVDPSGFTAARQSKLYGSTYHPNVFGTDRQSNSGENPMGLIEWVSQFEGGTVQCPSYDNSGALPQVTIFIAHAVNVLHSLFSLEESPTFADPNLIKEMNELMSLYDDTNDLQSSAGLSEAVKAAAGRYFVSIMTEGFGCMYSSPEVATKLESLFKLTASLTAEVNNNEGMSDITLSTFCQLDLGSFPRNLIFRMSYDYQGTTQSERTSDSVPEKDFVRAVSYRDIVKRMVPNTTFTFRTEDKAATPPKGSLMARIIEVDEQTADTLTFQLPPGTSCRLNIAPTLLELVTEVETSLAATGSVQLTSQGSDATVLRIVLAKYYQEATGVQTESVEKMVTSPEKLSLTLDLMRNRTDLAMVVVLEAGSKCGAFSISNDQNMLVIFENHHILLQIEKLDFYSLFSAEMQQELSFIVQKDSFPLDTTIHMYGFAPGHLNYSSCSYTSSSRAVEKIKRQCLLFRPLGVYVAEEVGDGTNDSDVNSNTMDTTNNTDTDPVSTHEAPNHDEGEDEQDVHHATTEPSLSAAIETVTATASSTASTTISASPSSAVGSSSVNISVDFCFPASALVLRSDGRYLRMSELRVGDAVLDAAGRYSPVLAFVHRDISTSANFVRIRTARGHTIALSAQHYMLTVDASTGARTLRTAHAVTNAHHVILARSGTVERVAAVSIVTMYGLFNPVTASGTIAVTTTDLRTNSHANDDGDEDKGVELVAASCFTQAVKVSTSMVILSPLRWAARFFGMYVGAVSWALRDGSAFWGRLLPRGANFIASGVAGGVRT